MGNTLVFKASASKATTSYNNIYERLLVGQLGDFYQAILLDFISFYRRFYSFEMVLLKLTQDWRAMLDKGELVVVV